MTQKNLFGPDTEEWHLSGYLKWTPKVPTTQTVRCSCRMWGAYGDDGTCPECHGLGYVNKNVELPPCPPIPEGLTEHMKKAWDEFFNNG